MVADVLVRLGKNLKRRRVRHKLSQEKLAGQAFVSVLHLRRIENGRANPSLKVLHKLTKILKISLRLLFLGL
ncbi:helix-turn-helix domain-containing protein [Patescibacteria group bacterium]|nr:helix-turn-helix domain-containing protein [Patescibacteria group bacterium]MCL5091287.1 helix-turn-helix domain-containing protein [Patescibacteria group bacterium]